MTAGNYDAVETADVGKRTTARNSGWNGCFEAHVIEVGMAENSLANRIRLSSEGDMPQIVGAGSKGKVVDPFQCLGQHEVGGSHGPEAGIAYLLNGIAPGDRSQARA